MAGRFDSTNVNAATEKGASISVPILAGKKEALVFSEIGPIPNVLPQVELEKSHAIKPVEANKNPAMKRKETSKKKPRAKSGIAR